MFNQVSKAGQVLPPLQLSIELIWVVDMGLEYDVENSRHYTNTMVALRTIDGAGEIRTIDNTYIIEKNSIILLPLKDIIHYKTIKPNWNFYWIEFNTLEQLPLAQYFFVPVQANEISLLNKCFELLSINDSYLVRQASAYFSSVLSGWLSQKSSKCFYISEMEKAVTLINSAPLQENITVEQFSHIFNMSLRSFRTAFFAYTGESPKNYILRRKLNAAVELLGIRNLSVGEISAKLGFSSPYYFSRIFKEKLGLSPLQYRNEQK